MKNHLTQKSAIVNFVDFAPRELDFWSKKEKASKVPRSREDIWDYMLAKFGAKTLAQKKDWSI